MNNLSDHESFIQSGSMSIRKLGPEDETLLLRWLTDENVLQYYEGRDSHYTLEK
ncbi:hypothetical protein [Guptibacillus algicola]|uniref:hypothetical protein n=1 Tax=Guptibacillus algicola TaxID=225844 RepID=UPI001CD5B123|nr:hypothetical protein [Alkalihalobacillus algicola]MCA0988390.1 hypothetical protein [Alkalihalobacillus algicola]